MPRRLVQLYAGLVLDGVSMALMVRSSLGVPWDMLHQGLAWRAAFGAAGIVLNGVATAAYIGVDLGPGPRDGLMTGLVRRTGVRWA